MASLPPKDHWWHVLRHIDVHGLPTLDSFYASAADAAGWDRATLESNWCPRRV